MASTRLVDELVVREAVENIESHRWRVGRRSTDRNEGRRVPGATDGDVADDATG
jgi:hypothetical protein